MQSSSIFFFFCDDGSVLANSMFVNIMSQLTHCTLADFSTVICWTNPFVFG